MGVGAVGLWRKVSQTHGQCGINTPLNPALFQIPQRTKPAPQTATCFTASSARCKLPQGAAIWTLKAHYSHTRQLNLVTEDSLSQPGCLRLEITHLGNIRLGREAPLPWGQKEEKNAGTQAHRLLADAGSGQGAEAPSFHPASALLSSLPCCKEHVHTHTHTHIPGIVLSGVLLEMWFGLKQEQMRDTRTSRSKKLSALVIITAPDCPSLR